ncbi:MAG: ABC transporter ATP-binding protein [Alphaproteobacteria bacterium]|nr:ABC transporter ATP-binding protein [Alphaproteobacteria bacterium]
MTRGAARENPGPSTLAARAVSVRFEGLTAVDRISLELQRGEVLGLIGPNGAGKTTLVNVLTGFQVPSEGTIWVVDADSTGWQPHRFARAGVIRTFQNGRLFKEFTVRENLEVAAIGVGLSARKARTRAAEVLDWLGLTARADERTDALSYGDERRVGIARALAAMPRWVLLDEPAAGLNDVECDQLMRTVAAIPERFGCGVLLIEHNMRVVMTVCHRIQVIDFGKTIAAGPPAAIQSDPQVIRAYLGVREQRR